MHGIAIQAQDHCLSGLENAFETLNFSFGFQGLGFEIRALKSKTPSPAFHLSI
jgi:hypothetical protein